MPIPPNTLFITKNLSIYHSPFVARTWQHFIDLLKRKNLQFTAFLDSNPPPASDRNQKRTWACFSPNLPKKFRPDPSTFYLVIVVTNEQTEKQRDRQTNAGKNIIPRFRGDNNDGHSLVKLNWQHLRWSTNLEISLPQLEFPYNTVQDKMAAQLKPTSQTQLDPFSRAGHATDRRTHNDNV